MPRKSNFITDAEVPDGHFFDTFGNGVNRKISKENLFAQIKKQAQTYYYDSEDDLKAADLEADPDNPIYVRVAPAWRLYRITSLAPVAPYDIALNNGATATLDRLENLQFLDVDDMVNAPYLKTGDIVHTAWLDEFGDNGGNAYEIGVFGADDGVLIIDLAFNGLQARRINIPIVDITYRVFNTKADMESDPTLFVGQRVRTLGYNDIGDGGGNDYEIVAAATGTDDGGSFIDLSGSGLQARGLFPNGVNIIQFGASPTAVATINTTAIQNAWNYAAPIGLEVRGAPGIFLIAKSGNQISSRDYGLLIPDGLKFDGVNKTAFTIRAGDLTDMDVVTTNRLSLVSDIEFKNTTIDGNSANQTPDGPNQTLGGMNLWIDNAENVTVDDVDSIDSAAFGFRLTKINNLSFGTLRCDHRPDINADGVHLKDCSNVVGDRIIIKTQGDDGLIINAETDDIHDISIGEVVVNAPVFVAAGRGIYISNADSNVTAGVQRKIYNVNIANAVTYECDATAVLLAFGDFYNIHINHVDYGSVVGLGLLVGSTNGLGVTGSVKNCSFKCALYDSQTNAVSITNTDGLVSFTSIDALIHNPGDGSVGAILSGEDCKFDIRMDYDPDGTKVTPLQGIRHAPGEPFSGNDIYLTVNGADRGLELNSGATDNNIYIGSITNSVTADIDFNSGANNNTIIGGSLESFQNAGTGNKVSTTRGATNYGRITLSPDGSGTDVIPHGLIASPDYFQAAVFSGSQIIATVSASDSTNLTITFRDYSGTLVTTGSHQVTWEASIF